MKSANNPTAMPTDKRPDAPATVQTELDVKEKRKHSQSENELESSQDKNPVPRDVKR